MISDIDWRDVGSTTASNGGTNAWNVWCVTKPITHESQWRLLRAHSQLAETRIELVKVQVQPSTRAYFEEVELSNVKCGEPMAQHKMHHTAADLVGLNLAPQSHLNIVNVVFHVANKVGCEIFSGTTTHARIVARQTGL